MPPFGFKICACEQRKEFSKVEDSLIVIYQYKNCQRDSLRLKLKKRDLTFI